MSDVLPRRLLSIRRQLGLNQSEFGKAVGVNQATVSRWENGSVPDVIALGKIAKLAGLTLAQLTNADVELSEAGPRLFVKGEVAAGVWRDAFEWEPDQWLPYQGGAHIDCPIEARFGLVVAGESMNAVYPPGTILDCVSCIHANITEYRSGQRVIVVRRRHGGEIEATVKEYLVTPDGVWLVPRSDNPAFQAPIPFNDGDSEIAETVIVAVVKGSYRPE